MGMYDSLFCDMPLPDGYNADGKAVFQTKDLDSLLDEYRITAEGRLRFEKQCGLSSHWSEPHDIEHSGIIRFYGIEGDVNGDDNLWVWHEYEAEFKEGKCGDIVLVKSVTGAELYA